MHEFDEQTTARFFDQAFPGVEKKVAPGTRLHARDQILVNQLLPRLSAAGASPPRILDFGCGRGDLLVHLLAAGHDVVGMDKYVGMRTYAEASASQLNASERIMAGGVEELAALPDRSFDLILMLGVLQYLSDAHYDEALRQVPRLLRPGGALVATFQNAFFDLFTFNKYTLDFVIHGLLGQALEAGERQRVEDAVASLITSAGQPAYSPTRARDNVFVRLTNPIAIDEQLRARGLTLVSKHFYEWFGLPPLLSSSLGDVSARIASGFEVNNATAWQGHFMANAFLAHIVPAELK